jgi:two-component system, NarL family, nitrate/nitrite response regulator NarL
MRTYESMLETSPVRIVLIDDQQLFRAGIQSLLAGSAEIVVVGEAGNRADALQLVQREQPDLALLELGMMDDGGSTLITELKAAAEHTRILVLTGTHDLELHRKAVRLGARGLLSKDCSAEVLAKAVQRVHCGEIWLERSMTAAVFDELSHRNTPPLNPEQAKIESLTDREREVIAAVGEGLKNKQIGTRLFISDVTVRHHLTSIYSKLGVTDRLELVIYAYRYGLVPIPK